MCSQPCLQTKFVADILGLQGLQLVMRWPCRYFYVDFAALSQLRSFEASVSTGFSAFNAAFFFVPYAIGFP
jgi:hypothetical protein